MTRENVTIQDLVNLFNLITGDNDTYEDWLEAFDNDEKIRIELIDYIKSELKANNYDGENDYHAMYWFAKGLKLHHKTQNAMLILMIIYLINFINIKFKIKYMISNVSESMKDLIVIYIKKTLHF